MGTFAGFFEAQCNPQCRPLRVQIDARSNGDYELTVSGGEHGTTVFAYLTVDQMRELAAELREAGL